MVARMVQLKVLLTAYYADSLEDIYIDEGDDRLKLYTDRGLCHLI